MSISVTQTATEPKLAFAVEVRDGRGSSRHTVTLDPALLARLATGRQVSGEAFVEAVSRSCSSASRRSRSCRVST
jgi:hypothetical protein